VAAHTSGATVPEFLSTLTGLTTVAPSPYGRRSVSPASLRIISLAGSGSRGVSARASCYGQSRFKTLFLYTLLALPASAARNAEQGTHVQGNTGVLAELFKYINQERKASTGGSRKCNKAAGCPVKINFFAAD